MELSQFKIRSFVIGLIVLGVIITLASWGISRIYNSYKDQSQTATIVEVTNPTPASLTNRATGLPTPANRQSQIQNVPSTTRPNPTPRPTSVPQTSKGGLTSQPKTGSDTIQIQNPGIVITSPTSGITVTNPMQVTGTGNVTSRVITLQILDQDGFLIGTTNVNVCYGVEACQFETLINFASPSTSTGYLYAYTINSLGEKAYETLVPLSF